MLVRTSYGRIPSNAAIAQLVERIHGKDEVSGSSPDRGSMAEFVGHPIVGVIFIIGLQVRIFSLAKIYDEKCPSLLHAIRNKLRLAGGGVIADRHDLLGLVLGDGLAAEE